MKNRFRRKGNYDTVKNIIRMNELSVKQSNKYFL